ncbi:MAG TPA: GDSL-type esterase/lipase family protein [Planctomycetota bacterium]|nr:GDSL-type esterase/lipase family protein [Planctomycetota bacterium]
MHVTRSVVAVVAAIAVSCATVPAHAQDNFKPLWGWSPYPGYLFYYMERPTPHRIEMKVVADGATQGFSLQLDFPDVDGNPGLIFRELSRKDGKDFSGYEGVTFWVKGDGSDAKGRVVLGYSNGPSATFPLKDTNWHRVDLKWTDFAPQPDAAKVGQLAFTLSSDSKRPAHYVIDRPGFAKSFAELAAADEKAKYGTGVYPSAVPERPKDFGRFVARGDQLVKTKAKLAAKQPVTLLFWGDSITNGAQLWPVGDAAAQDRAVYHSIFVEKLKQKYGYGDINRVKEATGGYQTHQAWPNIQKEVLDHKPDLVVVALGAGDTIYSNFDRFRDNWTKIVERLRAEGIEVICWTPTPIEFKVERGEPLAKYVRDYAAGHNLPLADVRACFLARGSEALGELIPDDAHPNPRGHELLAEVLTALFND